MLLDVTLRDGGFEVDFDWPEEYFAMVAAAVCAAGTEVAELGYIGGVPLEHSVARAGVGADLRPDHIAAARNAGLVLAAMVHPSALTSELDLHPYAEAGLGMVRLVYHPDWLTGITRVAAHARELGLQVAVNIALASRYTGAEIVEHAHGIDVAAGPDLVYLADTCGALHPGQVADLVSAVRTTIYAEVGFHAHDFLHLAYANALAAVEAGATYLDVSLLGLGRGGGNLAAEPLLLRHRLTEATYQQTELLRTCRHRLAATTARPADSLAVAVCATLNLTPVEEHALREFARLEQIDLDRGALWLLTHAREIPAPRVAALRAHWHEHAEQRG
ncbi:hypothetical protein ACTD5D_40725 [Nocardia takedensis]|uniref:hypothetical protein n=1 Tax=Nocardia takedensis TaxID=259390 RepID=UPI003F76063E